MESRAATMAGPKLLLVKLEYARTEMDASARRSMSTPYQPVQCRKTQFE
ncbi:hypothetical protein PG995_007028 [Apiospora arundinis]